MRPVPNHWPLATGWLAAGCQRRPDLATLSVPDPRPTETSDLDLVAALHCAALLPGLAANKAKDRT